MSTSKISPRAVGRGRIRRCLPALLLALFATGASAEEQGILMEAMSGAPNLINDTFTVTLGTYILESDTKVRLDGDIRRGHRSGLGQLRRRGWHPVPGRRRLALWRQPPAQAPRHVVQFLASTIGGVRPRNQLGRRHLSDQYHYRKFVRVRHLRARVRVRLPAAREPRAVGFVRPAPRAVQGRVVGRSRDRRRHGHRGDRRRRETQRTAAGDRRPRHLADQRNFWLDAMVQFFALEYDNVDGRLIDTRIGVLGSPRSGAGSASGTTASTWMSTSIAIVSPASSTGSTTGRRSSTACRSEPDHVTQPTFSRLIGNAHACPRSAMVRIDRARREAGWRARQQSSLCWRPARFD